jgi:hypothetical protein
MFGASQAAKQSLDYTEGLFFTGITKPKQAKTGDIYLDQNTKSYWCYTDNEWIEFVDTVNQPYQQSKLVISSIVKDGICGCCGSPDTGKMKCKYCQTTLRWYQ